MRLLLSALIAAIALLLLPAAARGAGDQVGISPATLDLGVLEPGTQTIASFTLISSSDQAFLVVVAEEPIRRDFYRVPPRTEWFENASEEEVLGWIQVLDTPVTLEPLSAALHAGSGSIKTAATVNAVVRVPEDAEPGYHALYLHPIPQRAPERGAGAAVLATAAIPVYFRVPGNAVRAGQVLDIVAGQPTETATPVRVFFKNTGTVTIGAVAAPLTIRDGQRVAYAGNSVFAYVKPGQTIALESFVPPGALGDGTYDAEVNVTYDTGSATLKTGLFLDVTARIISPPAAEAPGIAGVPLWLLALLAIIAGAALFARRR